MGRVVMFSSLSDCADVDAVQVSATSTASASRCHRGKYKCDKREGVVARNEVDSDFEEHDENGCGQSIIEPERT